MFFGGKEGEVANERAREVEAMSQGGSDGPCSSSDACEEGGLAEEAEGSDEPTDSSEEVYVDDGQPVKGYVIQDEPGEKLGAFYAYLDCYVHTLVLRLKAERPPVKRGRPVAQATELPDARPHASTNRVAVQSLTLGECDAAAVVSQDGTEELQVASVAPTSVVEVVVCDESTTAASEAAVQAPEASVVADQVPVESPAEPVAQVPDQRVELPELHEEALVADLGSAEPSPSEDALSAPAEPAVVETVEVAVEAPLPVTITTTAEKGPGTKKTRSPRRSDADRLYEALCERERKRGGRNFDIPKAFAWQFLGKGEPAAIAALLELLRLGKIVAPGWEPGKLPHWNKLNFPPEGSAHAPTARKAG